MTSSLLGGYLDSLPPPCHHVIFRLTPPPFVLVNGEKNWSATKQRTPVADEYFFSSAALSKFRFDITCLLVWFSVDLDNLKTLYWIWYVCFHKLSRKTPPHQVANRQWMTRNDHSLWQNYRQTSENVTKQRENLGTPKLSKRVENGMTI